LAVFGPGFLDSLQADVSKHPSCLKTLNKQLKKRWKHVRLSIILLVI